MQILLSNHNTCMVELSHLVGLNFMNKNYVHRHISTKLKHVNVLMVIKFVKPIVVYLAPCYRVVTVLMSRLSFLNQLRPELTGCMVICIRDYKQHRFTCWHFINYFVFCLQILFIYYLLLSDILLLL